MRFMPETLADTVQESERVNFLRAVTYAKRCLSSGGGGLGLGENATPKEATDNEKSSDER